jgi:ring-1,2-phenylacetyl-CoA epoxidase subunit PaaC
MFVADDIDENLRVMFDGPDLGAIAATWQDNIARIVGEATLTMPDDQPMASGGKQGRHTEHFGYLLAELQFMQRTYPGATW